MTQHPNPWTEALKLKSALQAAGLEEAVITFPARGSDGGPQPEFLVSEELGESPFLTPSMAKTVWAAIQKARVSLEGLTLSLEEGRMFLNEGDPGGFLMAWDPDAQSAEADFAQACAGSR